MHHPPQWRMALPLKSCDLWPRSCDHCTLSHEVAFFHPSPPHSLRHPLETQTNATLHHLLLLPRPLFLLCLTGGLVCCEAVQRGRRCFSILVAAALAVPAPHPAAATSSLTTPTPQVSQSHAVISGRILAQPSELRPAPGRRIAGCGEGSSALTDHCYCGNEKRDDS